LFLPLLAISHPRQEKESKTVVDISPFETGRKIVGDILNRPTGCRYQKACTYYGSLIFASAIGDSTITTQLAAKYAPYLSGKRKPRSGHVDYNVFGIWPFALYQNTGREIYLQQAKKQADSEFSRLNSDGLTSYSRYWVDDMYMVGSLQIQAYKATKDTLYLDRAARQLVVYCAKLQRENGLFFHRKDAPFFWGRGNGWAAAAMTEVLLVLPENNKYFPPLITAYRKMMKTLLQFQGADGMWHQLLDDPASYPESSCTGMFLYALASGLKSGWLPAGEYRENISKGWNALAGYVTPKGKVKNVCVGTNAKNNRKHYLTRPKRTGNFHGQAAVLWAATAMIRLNAER
jgi:unsaturated rhamnogalacturonyl hydrolase